MSLTDLAPLTAGAVGALMVLTWSLSLVTDDASIVDIVWGPGFVLVAGLSFLLADGADARRLLVLALTATWGLRLGLHLGVRNIGAGEDPRYVAMRRRWGRWFPLTSLVVVFALQAAIMWVVSLPVQAAQIPRTPIGTLDAFGAGVWLVGMAFETVGDWQLARFKADERNAGRVMDRGLWRYTRHPNYFGDALVWWGLGLVAVSAGGYAWTLIGPAVMTASLLRVSGVPLLERRMAKTRPGYAEYAARTSAFIPRPPRRR